MSDNGQKLTRATYEDPEIVEGYIQSNAIKPKQALLLQSFAKTIHGKRVLDLGCGPGHDSYLFAELGFEVTGLDYSAEMIRRARSLRQVKNQPRFLVGDARTLADYFGPNSFDAIWASASLLHIRPEDLARTVSGITSIAKNGAALYVGLKGGEGTVVVAEEKLGKPMQREFTLWTRENFLAQTAPHGWVLTDFFTEDGSMFRGQPAEWLRFFFTIKKPS